MKKNIPEINKRFLQVMEEKKYSGYRLSKEVKEISESKLTHIRSGRNEPGTDMVKGLLTKFPDINYNWLLTGTGEMLNRGEEPQNSDVKVVDDEDEADIFINKNDVKFMIYDDDTIKVEVDMMPFRAYASSDIDCYFDKEYRENEFNKAIFTVDRVAKGLYLGFKSQNESMNGGGINDTPSNAELLCRELGRHLWKSLHDTEYGFVLMTKTAIRHKDITNYNEKTGMFTLHSRNPDEEDFEEHINDIHRIFKVIKRTF